jgi:hypothetical protein
MLAACAFLSEAQAVSPPPDGCYPNFTTAEGCNALFSLTTGAGNTGLGWYSLFRNTTSNFNTGVGAGALALTTTDNNTAVGALALFLNTIGENNAAVGANALVHNDNGSFNNAFGTNTLFSNVGGAFNNARGRNALSNNVNGSENNAFGDLAMEDNVSGLSNTAIGDDALRNCVDGSFNVAVGDEAGTSIIHGSNMVAIGARGDGPWADTPHTCFIGSIYNRVVSDPDSQQAVYVDQFNVVGVFNSSRRYKHEIEPMDKASEKLYRLNPVTFKFKSDWKSTTQYGLIAEEAAELDPHLVAHGKDGEIATVHYHKINAMLLNEFLKEHKKVEELQKTVAQQQIGMETLTAQLKEQAAQIQKVCAQLGMSLPATKVVVNEP